MVAPWTYREEEHLGALAYSLFDPAGERSAIGLIRWDAERVCRAMNTGPDLLEALKAVDRQVFCDCPEHSHCITHEPGCFIPILRAALAKATGDAS